MIQGGIGGGNTKTGLIYEAKVDLETFLNNQSGYTVKDMDIFFNKELVGNIFKKHDLYRFLANKGIDWRKHLSKKLLPDNCIYVIINNTINIIEIKHQKVRGSVDEKLQTCDFKRKQYIKLSSELNRKVEYIYILSDWFRQDSYKDTRDYIISVGCSYYYNYIPLHELGLPIPQIE